MELVNKLVEKYPTQEEVKETLDNADTGSSIPENIRNLAIDITSGAAAGAALGGIGAKIFSKKPAQAATREAIEQLKNGVDDALGHQRSLIKKGKSNDWGVLKLMKQNEEAAKSVAEGGNGKKALKTVLKNTQREAELGPRFMEDIEMILQNDAGLSEKEVKKAIKEFTKENANSVELITLLEAKEPIATYSHSLGVQDLAYRLAKKMGLDDEKAKKIADAALVHDIGKIQVPDAVINSKADFKKPQHQPLKKWMDEHDVEGGKILESDPFKSNIARWHHSEYGPYVGDEVGLVTAADKYEALTSNKRSYKPGRSVDKTFSIMGEEVEKGKIRQEDLDLLKELRENKQLPDRYNYESPLESPYKSMKANEIKKQVASDYADEFFKEEAKKWASFGAGLGAGFNADRGGVQPSSLPSLSEILSEFSPSFKSKAEKLEDIKRWYNKGFTNGEIDKLIVSTDFKDNKQVTKLWKLMHDQIKD